MEDILMKVRFASVYDLKMMKETLDHLSMIIDCRLRQLSDGLDKLLINYLTIENIDYEIISPTKYQIKINHKIFCIEISDLTKSQYRVSHYDNKDISETFTCMSYMINYIKSYNNNKEDLMFDFD